MGEEKNTELCLVQAAESQQEKRNKAGVLRFMKQKYGYFGLLCALFSVFYTFCRYKNPAGITYPLLAAGSVVFCMLILKKFALAWKKESTFLAAAILLLGASTAMTQNEVLHLWNAMGIVLLLFCLMMNQIFEQRNWSVGRSIAQLMHDFLQLIAVCGYPFIHLAAYRRGEKDTAQTQESVIGSEKAGAEEPGKECPGAWRAEQENPACGEAAAASGKREAAGKAGRAVLIGFFIAIPLAFVVLLLLLSADEVFCRLFSGIFQDISLPSNLFGIVVTALLMYTLSYSFIASTMAKEERKGKEETEKADPLIAITFMTVLGGIYLVFCAIQIYYLFIHGAVGLPEGISYADYARRGFFELLFVSALNLLLLIVSLESFRESRVLKWVLTVISGCTFLLIGSSAYRMILYVQAYDLTFLRVLVLWFLALLTIWMVGGVVYIWNRKFSYFRFSVLVVTVFYLALSLGRPDRLIARYNIAMTQELHEEQVEYLTFGLSADAASEVLQIPEEKYAAGEEEQIRERLEHYRQGLLETYKEIPLRSWNLSKWEACEAAGRK